MLELRPAVLSALLLLTVSAMAEPRRIGRWDFDSQQLTTQRATASGPQASDRVDGLRGRAARFTDKCDPVVFPLPRDENGKEADPTSMSVRFWYRPDWISRTGRPTGGPGEWVRLLVIGDRAARPQEGWWEFSLDPGGDRFEFSCSSGRGEPLTVTGLPVAFQAGVWAEIVLNVFPGRIVAYKDGQVAIDTEAPRIPAPSRAALSRGIAVGSRHDGTQAARGVIDEVEVFDGRWNRVEVTKLGRVLSAVPTQSGDGLELRWKLPPGRKVEIQRAEVGNTNWVSLGQVEDEERFTDTRLQPGQLYQYRLLTNRVPCKLDIIAGLRLPPIESRGTVAVLVDQTLADGLREPLAQLERDLAGDGWRVVRRSAPRHNDDQWRANTNAIREIREWVIQQWKASNQELRALFIIGHVAIPYSGMEAEDTHTGRGDNHLGAWPADHYYADTDGIWTDQKEYPRNLSAPRFPITHNVPNDGKFDTSWVAPNAQGRSNLEMAFGRVDFASMPAFAKGRNGELQLIRQYLGKTHRYRMGEMPASPRAVVGMYVNAGSDFALLPSAFRAGSRLFGVTDREVCEGDLFSLPQGETATWGFQSGFANVDRFRTGTPHSLFSYNLSDSKRQPRVLFAMLLGSWFGDWAVGENNMLRAVITSKDYGLASIWVRYTEWRFDPLAHGGTLGDAQLRTANEVLYPNNINLGTTRTLTIMGDPTLRLHVTRPPTDLRASRRGGNVRLQWKKSADADAGYFVYRSQSGLEGTFERLNKEPVTTLEFNDSNPVSKGTYMVRAAQLISTGSGSYTNLSLGVVATP